MAKVAASLAEERDRKEAFIRRNASLRADDRSYESQKAENKIRDQADAIADLRAQRRNASKTVFISPSFD